jgi:hypothetical protein
MEFQALIEEILRKRGIADLSSKENGAELSFKVNYPPIEVQVRILRSSKAVVMTAHLRLVRNETSPHEICEEAPNVGNDLNEFSLKAELPIGGSQATEKSVERLLSSLLDLCSQYAGAIRGSLAGKRG